MLIVQKFGGSSLADAARIKRAARRLIHTVEQGHQTVAVVSAFRRTDGNGHRKNGKIRR